MRKFIVTLVLAITLITGVWWFVGRPDTETKNPNHSQNTEAPASEMSKLVADLSQDYPDVAISVSITDLQNDQAYQWGDDAPFGAASVAKLITAAAIFNQIEEGNLDSNAEIEGHTITEDLKQLIEKSDNEAWQRFNDYLGTEELESYADRIGVKSYTREGQTVTSEDIALLLTKLYRGELLNTEHTDQLLEYMKNANYTQYIQAVVPESMVSYHKVGFLEDRVHDVAIITDGDQAIALVIFTKGPAAYDQDMAADIIHRVTEQAIDTFL